MTKTKETKRIEGMLVKQTAGQMGRFGALEVTYAYHMGGKGYQRCDYVEITSDAEVICYEIKVSLSDLKSQNQLTFLGNKNYLVVSENLWRKMKHIYSLSWPKQQKYHLPYFGDAGIIVAKKGNPDDGYPDSGYLKIVRGAKHHNVRFTLRAAFLEGVARAASRDFAKLYLKENK